VRYFVHGVDRENIDEQLEGLAESHWAYMDEMAATVLPRIPAAEYPRINEAAAAALASGSDYTDGFEFGLDLILDGLEWLRRVPACLGPAGWLGLDLDERTDLEEVAELLEDSFRLTAPARLVATLDRRGPRATPGG
jgi:hypothetical protein